MLIITQLKLKRRNFNILNEIFRVRDLLVSRIMIWRAINVYKIMISHQSWRENFSRFVSVNLGNPEKVSFQEPPNK